MAYGTTGSSSRRAVALGLLGVLLSFVSAALIVTIHLRPMAGDEAAHFDYAYQLWHGELPVFEDGLDVRPPVKPLPPFQWTSQHPPLFYLIQAPIVGPAASSGHWRSGMLAARGVNVLISVFAILAIAWTVSLAVRRQRHLWSVAAVALVTPLFTVVSYAGSLYNDMLAVLFVALALGLSILVLRQGLSRRRVAAAAVVAIGGMATRGSFVATLTILLAALMIAGLLHGRGSTLARAFLGFRASVSVVGITVLTTGWFYLRNLQRTGSIFGTRPEFAEKLGRERHTIGEVIMSPDFWLHYRRLFFLGSTTRQLLVGGLLFGLVIVSALVGVVIRRAWRGASFLSVAVILVMVLQAAAVVAMQSVYVSGGGGMQIRYSLQALPVVSLVLAAGALAWSRLHGMGVLLVATVSWIIFLDQIKVFRMLGEGRTANGIPSIVTLAFASGIIGGLVMLAIALPKLDGSFLNPPGPGESSEGGRDNTESKAPEADELQDSLGRAGPSRIHK